MDAILYFHHRGLTEPTTRKHLALARAFNPHDEVIPLSYPEHSPDSYHQQKNHFDELAYDWFIRTNPKHERIVLLEWDSLCLQPFKDFYGDAYNKKAVGSVIVKPWSDELTQTICGGFEIRQREWTFFTQNRSAELYPYLRGIVPVSCAMFAHDAFFNMCEIWKTNREAYDQLGCECRLGTLACHAGYEPQPIRSDCQKYVSCQDVNIDQGPRVYHRVRT